MRNSSNKNVREYYNQVHYSDSKILERLERKLKLDDPWYRLILYILKKHNVELNGLHVLELGCGLGGFTRFLAQQDAIVTGVDFSWKALTKAGSIKKSSSSNQIDYVIASGECLPFHDCTFDLVICSETLEHTFAINRVLSEIKRVSMPMGQIIITTPNSIIRLPYDIIARTYGIGQPEELINYFTIRKKIINAELQIIDEWGADFWLDMLIPELIPEGRLNFPQFHKVIDILCKSEYPAWRILAGTVGFLLQKKDTTQ
jgi:ubiquinone/menaquinone biosynthesis C-methylase UbiE